MTRSTTSPRLFVDAGLHTGAEIAANGAQAHYLATVLRRASGDAVRVFNGRDGEWAAVLTISRRDRVTLTATEPTRPQTPEPGPWLLFALLKRDATDLVVRQAVELGASRIVPVLTGRTNAGHVNIDRLRAIAIEAAEQCERLTIPPVEPPARLESALDSWPANRRLFAALERLDGPPGGFPAASADRDGALLIGPEGGFSPAERMLLSKNPGITPISLGPLILRAETAAAAGLALLRAMGSAGYDGST